VVEVAVVGLDTSSPASLSLVRSPGVSSEAGTRNPAEGVTGVEAEVEGAGYTRTWLSVAPERQSWGQQAGQQTCQH
jgi:hypothetical protein